MVQGPDPYRLPAPNSKTGSIPFWDPSKGTSTLQAGTESHELSRKSIVIEGIADSDAERTSAVDAGDGTAQTGHVDDCEALSARGGNGGHSASLDAEARASVEMPLTDDSEVKPLAAQPQTDRVAQRTVTALAALKAQLKQQAAENVQLEEMLKMADVEVSSAPPC